jgi:purine-nucleoside phosphorylase
MLYDDALEVTNYIRSKTKITPQVGVILGSGLSSLLNAITEKTVFTLDELPHMKASQVQGHDSLIVLGQFEGVSVVMFSGRSHLYDGHGMDIIALPIIVMKQLGINRLVITNACGAINKNYKPGDFMLIKDHINTTGQTPLRGAYDPRLGDRFPDVTNIYDQDIQAYQSFANALKVNIHHGVYAFWHGPSYETPAEIKMLKTFGADVVGMSTVPESLMANALGIKVTGISVITNMASGILDQPLSHDEVLETANKVISPFQSIVRFAIKKDA